MSDVKKFYENESRNSDNNTDNNGTQNVNVYESAMSGFEGMVYEETAEEKSKNMKSTLESVTDTEIEALTDADLEAIRVNKEERLKQEEKLIEEKKQEKDKKKLEREDAGIEIFTGLFSFFLFLASITGIGYGLIFKRYRLSDFHDVLSNFQMKVLTGMPTRIQKKRDKKNQKRYMNEQIRNQDRMDAREINRAGGGLSLKGIAIGFKRGVNMFGKGKAFRRGSFLQYLKFLFIVCVIYYIYKSGFKVSNIPSYITGSPILRVVLIVIFVYLIMWLIGIFISPIMLTSVLDKKNVKLDERAAEHNKSVEEYKNGKFKTEVSVTLEDLTRDDKAEYILQKRNGAEN